MFAAEYTTLANFTGQWAISMQRRDSPDQAWRLHSCNATWIGSACNQPPIAGHSPSQVKIVFVRRNATAGALRTWKGGVPTEIKVRLDYGATVQVDRGWRKKNQAWPGVSQTGWVESGLRQGYVWPWAGGGVCVLLVSHAPLGF